MAVVLGPTSAARMPTLVMRKLRLVAGERATGDKASEPAPRHDPKRWYQRPTVRALRRQQIDSENREYRRKWDKRENDETRPPASETIHLGGLVLTEAFTPATVSSLYKALERVGPVITKTESRNGLSS
jgi:hypothetical protein